MSSDLAVRNSTGTSIASTSAEQSFALTNNMLMVIAKSNQPLQQEIQKTAVTIENFMEQMKHNFEALSQENALLRTELVKEKTRNQESQAVYQAEIKAFNETVNTFKDTANSRIAKLEKTINILQNSLVASQHAHNSLQNSHHSLVNQLRK